MSTQSSTQSILEVANKAKRLLLQEKISPQIGINCLSNLRMEMQSLTDSELSDIVTYETTDAAAANLMEKYVSQPGIRIDFSEFVLAHLNIFIDELMLVSSDCH